MEKIVTDNFTGTNPEPRNSNTPLRFLTATSIIGDKVHDEKDEAMGKIMDIMIDINAAKIDYVVIEFGGFLGINMKCFAIPFHLLEVNSEKQIFVFKGKKEMLQDAPGFDPQHWPDTNFHAEENYWHFV